MFGFFKKLFGIKEIEIRRIDVHQEMNHFYDNLPPISYMAAFGIDAALVKYPDNAQLIEYKKQLDKAAAFLNSGK